MRQTHPKRSRAAGFTLLEVLVATAIMGIAIVGLLAALGGSVRNAARLTVHDRMAMRARAKMSEIMVQGDLPLEAEFDGSFPPAAEGEEAGFHAVAGIVEAPPRATPGMSVLQRVTLRVWWKEGARLRTMDLESFRRNTIPRTVQQ